MESSLDCNASAIAHFNELHPPFAPQLIAPPEHLRVGREGRAGALVLQLIEPPSLHAESEDAQMFALRVRLVIDRCGQEVPFLNMGADLFIAHGQGAGDLIDAHHFLAMREEPGRFKLFGVGLHARLVRWTHFRLRISDWRLQRVDLR